MTAYTPDMLAERWKCSPQHVRNLVKGGTLRAYRLGKLLRIPQDAVDEVEQCRTGSEGCEESSASHGTSTGSGTVTRLTAEQRARLRSKRRESTTN